MENYSIIIEEINNYNNLFHMKKEFIKFIKNLEDFELTEFKQDILNELESYKINYPNSIESENTYIERYNYGIEAINKIIKERSNINNLNINSNNININSNNTNSKETENTFNKYWWKLVIPVLVAIIIWYLTK